MNIYRPVRQTVELLKAAMEEGWTTLRSRLEGMTDDEFFWVMAAHDLHHGGEIGCLRDLYRTQQSRDMP